MEKGSEGKGLPPSEILNTPLVPLDIIIIIIFATSPTLVSTVVPNSVNMVLHQCHQNCSH